MEGSMKNLVIASTAASFVGGMGFGRCGTDRFADLLLSARLSSVTEVKSRVGDALISGILWALVAAIVTFVAAISVVNLFRLL
jgi:hypothetical protein